MKNAPRILALSCFLWVTSLPAFSQGQSSSGPSSQSLAKIAGPAMAASHAYRYVEELSDNIGARLTGSPQDAAAERWALARMQAIGLNNAHLERWPLEQGWERGTAQAVLISPLNKRLAVASYGWVGSTRPEGVEADVVSINTDLLPEQIQKSVSHSAGKILFLFAQGKQHKSSLETYAQLSKLVETAAAAHAVAVLSGADNVQAEGMVMVHTGMLSFSPAGYSIPVLDVAPEDRLLIERYLIDGKQVRMKINVENRFLPGPIETANVVGDIPGVTHPEEVLVVAAHLDSWDLAQGATDDGVGVAVVLGAAEAILESGLKPQRTIRFVLFTGEEEGLLGSKAYLKAHQADLPNHLGAIVIDLGQGPITKMELGGRTELIPAMEEFAAAITGYGPLEVNDSFLLFNDSYSFFISGLPGICFAQNSRDYQAIHHSPADTLDKVDPAALIHNTAVMALTAYWIADYKSRLGTLWSPGKTAQMLTEKKQREIFEPLGLWPF